MERRTLIVLLAFLVPTTALRALSRDELVRYGFSDATSAAVAPAVAPAAAPRRNASPPGAAEERPGSSTATAPDRGDGDSPTSPNPFAGGGIGPANRDPLSPHRIPSPFVRQIGRRSFAQPRVDARGFDAGRVLVPVEARPAATAPSTPPVDAPVGHDRRQPVAGIPVPPTQGVARCTSCHEDRRGHPKASHRGFLVHAPSVSERERGCEACHGPGGSHPAPNSTILAFSKLGAEKIADVCLDCHAMKRRVRPRRWVGSPHERANLACTTCHSEHGFTEEKLLRRRANELCLSCHRAQAHDFRRRSAHPLKGEDFEPLRGMQSSRLRCVDCHDPHGPDHPEDRERRSRELCSSCHPQRRGPFVFEHPVSTDLGRGCLTCHLAHGSPNRRLMRVAGDRGPCLRCHADRVTHQSGQSCWNASCHRDVHGSNRDFLYRRP